MSKPEYRADEPDDATTELPKVPVTGRDPDPLDPASLAWSTGGSLPASDPPEAASGGRVPGAPPSELTDVSFPTAWRGYEPTAVDAYVRQVTRTIADLEGNRSPAEAVRRALDRVGEETSSILQEAEQTAERMTERSRSRASERLEQAEREADEITLAARTRLRQLDADVDRIWLERQRLIDDTRRLAERLEQIADQAEERFPAEDEDTVTVTVDDTGAGDSMPAAAADETARFPPPPFAAPSGPRAATDAPDAGMTGPEPSPFGVDAPSAAAEAGSDHEREDAGPGIPDTESMWTVRSPASEFEANTEGDAGAPGGAVHEDAAPSGVLPDSAVEHVPLASPWPEPAAAAAPAAADDDDDERPKPSDWSDPTEGNVGVDADGDGGEAIISWSTPDPEQSHDPPPGDPLDPRHEHGS